MAKFIAYQKLHKKQQRAIDREKRGTWGEVNPVTRCAPSTNPYDRTTENRRWQTEAHKERSDNGGFVLLLCAYTVALAIDQAA